MRKPNYRFRITDGSVIVEHRVSIRNAILVPFAMVLCVYGVSPDIRRAIADFYTSRDLSSGVLVFMLLLLPVLLALSWFRFASGEVLYCDRNELRFARRRMWGRWNRFQFPSSDVKKLRRVFRGSGKTRGYSVLTFDVQGRTHDMLENLTYTDSDRVLRACRSMGINVVIDEADAMLKDIEKRGWWINPFRTDDLGK